MYCGVQKSMRTGPSQRFDHSMRRVCTAFVCALCNNMLAVCWSIAIMDMMSARTRLPNDGPAMLTKSQEGDGSAMRGAGGSGHSPTVAGSTLSLGPLMQLYPARSYLMVRWTIYAWCSGILQSLE